MQIFGNKYIINSDPLADDTAEVIGKSDKGVCYFSTDTAALKLLLYQCRVYLIFTPMETSYKSISFLQCLNFIIVFAFVNLDVAQILRH